MHSSEPRDDGDADDARDGDGESLSVPGGEGPRKVVVARIFLFALFIVALILAPALVSHAKAAGVLLRLSDAGGDPMGLREFRVVPITRVDLTIPLGDENLRAYRYEPLTGPGTLGLVLVHGVHYRGIDETRLVRFAESLAKTGITVLTPELPSLADYRIDHSAVVEIGGAAKALREQLGGEKPVGVVGISFAGSLGLLAAADPVLGKDIGYVVTVGSYDDLARVCRFYATGSIERPDGVAVKLHPHDYGPVVWMYSHLEDFFPAEGIDDVRVALRAWLHEDFTEAKADAVRLPDTSRKKLEALFAGDIATAAPDLLADVNRHEKDLEALSPHGHLDGIKIAVFALHGSDDRLIPPSETLWLAHDLPPGMLAVALISRALTHVEIGEGASLMDRLQAVHFMAGVLAESRHPG
jgi:pimeloyl-ACP methyl ester carboxylesterase